MKLVITRESRIDVSGAYAGDEIFVARGDLEYGQFLKQCYKQLNITYPKYYKMDRLCKLGFIAAELLLKEHLLFQQYERDKIGVIINNYHSSLDADKKHLKSIEEGIPSPAIFVYTLPNIVVGELCIRHRINGEGSCFLFPSEKRGQMKPYLWQMFQKEGYKACIVGSVDYSQRSYFAQLHLIEIKDAVDKHIAKFDEIFN